MCVCACVCACVHACEGWDTQCKLIGWWPYVVVHMFTKHMQATSSYSTNDSSLYVVTAH